MDRTNTVNAVTLTFILVFSLATLDSWRTDTRWLAQWADQLVYPPKRTASHGALSRPGWHQGLALELQCW